MEGQFRPEAPSRRVPYGSEGVSPERVPGAWPLLGHAPLLLRDPLRALARAGRAGPVALLRLGPVPAYLITDPELIHRILVPDAASYDKGFQFDALRGLIGDGIGTSSGVRHRRHKRLLRPAFDHAHVSRYRLEMAAQVADYLDARWDRHAAAPDLALDVAHATTSDLALDVAHAAASDLALDVAHAAASDLALDVAQEARILAMRLVTHSMSGSAIAADEVTRSLPVLLSGVGRRALLPVKALDLVPTAGNRRFAQSLKAVHALADDMVARHRADCASEDADVLPTLLSVLLAAVDEEGEGLTDAEAHDEIMTLLLAGTETVAGVVAWTLHRLARDPVLQELVREDLAAAGESALQPGLAERVVKEVMRLYPPGWVLGRRPLVDVRLGGVDVPARSQVLLNFYGLHRNPGVFPEPGRFDPDRWIEPVRAAVSEHYLPFGSGPHGCLGEGFAWAEIMAVLRAVLARYRLRPVPGSTVRAVARTTLHPDTVPLLLTRLA